MDRKNQTKAEARAELALNLRGFAGSLLNASDVLRRRLVGTAESVHWPFIREAAVDGARGLSVVIEERALKPLAARAVRASAVVLGAPPLPLDQAYAEALLISQWGPSIPPGVRAILDASKE